MNTITIKPVEITGNCRANLTPDDEFYITGMALENPCQSRLCYLALGHFPPIIAQLQQGSQFYAHAACPDCLSRPDRENCVTFLLGHADKWELCRAISDYHRLRRRYPEPETARHLRAQAIRRQQQGQYAEAVQTMQAALAEMKSSLSPAHPRA
ncbi:MAG: tetratricopeptide repeat protein [Anaerolineae bacterium]